MHALIVGADRLGSIPQTLALYGITVGHHVTGRNPAHQRSPSHIKGMDVVILFTDYLNHNAMRNYREIANKRQVQLVVCRRTHCDLVKNLDKLQAHRQFLDA
jgi:hypothetical protein